MSRARRHLPRLLPLLGGASLLVAAPAPARAQPEPPPADAPELASGVRGRIVDADSGEPIPDVIVTVVGQRARAITADDGTYQLDLPRGTYTLRYAGDLYQRQRVRGVVVRARGVTSVDLRLSWEEIEEVVVIAPPDTGSAAVQTVRRRKRATVSDAISSEQISRSADSNASDAAKRMVGATIQDGRYVVLRGLGGRYSLTLLNGVPLPSPDPDVPAAPLDLFPASLLANLTVNKTFSPDMPASFAGGALSIETRSFPSRFTLKVRGGLSANSESSFRSVNQYDGGDLDVLGYDDGTRALPDAIPDGQLAGDPSLTDEQLREQVTAFPNTWTLEPDRAGPNGSLGVTVGDTLRAGKQALGYFASASYSHGHGRRQTHLERVGEPDPDGGGYLPSVLQLDENQGSETAALNGLFTAGWTPSARHNLGFIGLHAHNADDLGSQVTGTDNNTSIIDRTRLRFLERQLTFGQVVGEHALGGGRVVLGWQANLARVSQGEPDTRDLLRSQLPDGRWLISRNAGSSERLFADLGDTSGGGGLDVTVPFEDVKVKVGASYLHTVRDYQARRFHFDIGGDMQFEPVEQAFAPSNDRMSFYEATLPTDGYGATRGITSAYALADVALGDDVRVVGGARFERSRLDLALESKIDLMAPPMDVAARDDRAILPAVNAVYALGRSNLRAAYGQTVARPNFREIAPALYYDFVRRRAIGGNPDLVETRIHNADLRWETFLGDGDVLAASAFYKRFRDPIEATIEDAGSGENIGFSNSPRAETYGLELEARTGLGRVHRALSPLSLSANVALIDSAISDGGVERPLQGQSPYVINLGLGYSSAKGGTTVDLLYNAFGRRIEEVGTGGSGNVYEEPVHRLDASLGQALTDQLKFKLSATNLLNQRVVRTQNDVEILAYRLGVAVIASVEFSVE